MSSQRCLHAFTQTCRTAVRSSRSQQTSLISSNTRIVNALQFPRQERNFTTSRQTRQNSKLDRTLDTLIQSSESSRTTPKYGKNRLTPGAGRTPKLDAMNSLNRSGSDVTFNPAGSLSSLIGDVGAFDLPPMASTRKAMELGPNIGRSVLVDKGDLSKALNGLKTQIRINNVREDSIQQKFHERRGMKKKRMKRERFRKRFKEGFKRMVSIVLEMKRQGL